ncbi:MAG: cyclodeaminase/cyclohydrolase family protein [Caldiserica bacterium]|nr:cyclodeaminase/cyclohydrolase family protein [Caldisericota bacterium]
MKAYQSYVQARNLPKNTAGEKEARKQAINKAILKATQVPLQVMEKSLRVLELNKALLGKSNPYLVSDIGVSAEFAHASLNSACFNVEINLPYLQEATRREIEEKVRFIRGKDSSLYEEIISGVRRES